MHILQNELWRSQRDQSYYGMAGYMEPLALADQTVRLQHKKERNDPTKLTKSKCVFFSPWFSVCPFSQQVTPGVVFFSRRLHTMTYGLVHVYRVSVTRVCMTVRSCFVVWTVLQCCTVVGGHASGNKMHARWGGKPRLHSTPDPCSKSSAQTHNLSVADLLFPFLTFVRSCEVVAFRFEILLVVFRKKNIVNHHTWHQELV